MKKANQKMNTKEIVCIGMFAAVLAVCSQIAIPMPSGVPVTLQTFAVALTGSVLAWKKGCISTLLYILIGVIGLPVFTGFRGGLQVLVSHTGGFLWGFIFIALLCGTGVMFQNRVVGIVLGMLGLLICHLLGCLQFMFLTNSSFIDSFVLISLPYLLKDAVLVIAGIVLGGKIRKQLWRAGLYGI